MCDLLVDNGVIDGAEYDGNVENPLSRLYDVILGGTPFFYISCRVPA